MMITADITPTRAAELLEATRSDFNFACRNRWAHTLPAAPTSPAQFARRIAAGLDLGARPVCPADPVLLTCMLLGMYEHHPDYQDEPAKAVVALRDAIDDPAKLEAKWRVVLGFNLLRGLIKLGRPAPLSIGFIWPKPPGRLSGLAGMGIAIPVSVVQTTLGARLRKRSFTEWLTLRTILNNRARWPAGVPSDRQRLPASPPVRLTAAMISPAQLPDAVLGAMCDAAEDAAQLCFLFAMRRGMKAVPSWLAWPLFATAGLIRPIAPWLSAMANGQPVSADGLPTVWLRDYLAGMPQLDRKPHTEVVRRITNKWIDMLREQEEYPQDFARKVAAGTFNQSLV